MKVTTEMQKSLAKYLLKENSKPLLNELNRSVISSDKVVDIYFQVYPGVDELATGFDELCDLANENDIEVVPAEELRETPDGSFMYY